MQWFKTGSTTGTGAALNVVVGWIPSRVEVWNPNTGAKAIWDATESSITRVSAFGNVTGMLNLAGAAIGSTPQNCANRAFDYMIAGVKYTKAAVAAGTAPTATTVPKDKYGLFGFELAADGTLDNKDAADNATGYNTEALALAALPTASASHLLAFYFTVMRTNAAGFVGATTSLADAETTVKYYNVGPVTELTTVTGLTTYSGTSGYGFSIGTSSKINVSGDTIYWNAWRG